MLFKTFSAAVFGIDAYLVEVEVDVAPAFEGHFTVVGLPDIAVKESRERIRAAQLRILFSRHPLRHHQSRARGHSQGRLGARSAHGAGARWLPGNFLRQNSGYSRFPWRAFAGWRRAFRARSPLRRPRLARTRHHT